MLKGGESASFDPKIRSLSGPAGCPLFDEGGSAFSIVRFAGHLINAGLGVADRAAGVVVRHVEGKLAFGGAQRVGADGVDEGAGVVVGGGEDVGTSDAAVGEPHVGGFTSEDWAAGEEKVSGSAESDEAGEEPGEAVFGGEVERAVGGGELGIFCDDADVAPAGDDEADTGGGAVDGGDGDGFESEKVGEVGVERGVDAIAGVGDVIGGSGVVAAAVDVSFEGLAVSAGTERLAVGIAGDDDDANRGVIFRGLKKVTQLRVHPASPRVVAMGARQSDGPDAIDEIPAGCFEFHLVGKSA